MLNEKNPGPIIVYSEWGQLDTYKYACSKKDWKERYLSINSR